MVVGWECPGLVMESAQPISVDCEASGHAKMHDERFAGGQVRSEKLGHPAKPLHPRAREAACEILGEWKTQIWPVHNETNDPAALKGWDQSAANRLDFGQFRHTAVIYIVQTQAAMAFPMTNADPFSETAPFGFEDIPAEEKEGRVRGVFDSVAPRYDLMNDFMSAGIHRLWKHDTMARVNPQPGETLLDVAGGTGELAKAFLDRADRAEKRRNAARPASAIVCDINEEMLKAGQARRDMQQYGDRIDWVCGNAEALPFEDRSFDALTIAFGIRNVTHRDKALAEFRRVLKPAGRLAVLEFSHMTAPLLQRAYDTYSFNVIPALGGLVTGDRASYQYLVESIRRFPDQETFRAEVEAAGFRQVSATNFSGGIAALHFGWAV